MGELTRYQIQAEESSEVGGRLKALRRIISRGGPGAALVPVRYVRRIQMVRNESIQALGDAPHTRCLALPLADLRQLIEEEKFLIDTTAMADPAVLVAEPTLTALETINDDAAKRYLLAAEYHARVDYRLAGSRTRLGHAGLDPVRDALGVDGYEEVREVLRSERRLLDPADELEVVGELIATMLEFRAFEPELMRMWFPGIDRDAVLAAIDALDIELGVADLMGESGASVAEPYLAGAFLQSEPIEDEADLSKEEDPTSVTKLRNRADYEAGRGNLVRAMLLRQRASRRANPGVAGIDEESETQLAALAGRLTDAVRAHDLVDTFATDAKPGEDTKRVQIPDADDGGDRPTQDEWATALRPLVASIGSAPWPEAAKLLYDLQKACIDFERPGYRFSITDKFWSMGKLPAWRELTRQVPARVHHHLRRAVHRVHLIDARETPISDDDKAKLKKVLERARADVARRMREAYRPIVTATLAESGFVPANVPEVVALGKLTDWLLDRVEHRDYIGFGDLRDAISLSDIKMTDVDTVEELVGGDSLLIADRKLADRMPGVYRRGPIYMRLLQRASSLAFGTWGGRKITWFLVLPALAAYLTIEALTHIVGWFIPHGSGDAHADGEHTDDGHTDDAHEHNKDGDHSGDHSGDNQSGDHHPDHDGLGQHAHDEASSTDTDTAAPDNGDILISASAAEAQPQTQAQTQAAGEKKADDHHDAAHAAHTPGIADLLLAIVILSAMQSALVRGWLATGGKWVWRGLRGVLWDLPGWFLQLKAVRFVLVARVARIAIRNVIAPGAITAVLGVYVIQPGGRDLEDWQFILSLVGVFACVSLLLNVRIVRLVEALAHEQFNFWWEKARHHLLPNIIRWTFDVFRRFVKMFEFISYTVDELIRFRRGENRFSMVGKVFAGVMWGMVMYVVTIYITLLIEPQINPIKHFPVVTVSHKIMIPMLKDITVAMIAITEPLMGTALATSFSLVTVFLLPGVFGFLAWELTSNWRLYASTRPPELRPVIVGSHGERMSTLLRPGFHSGPVPKLWRRMRRAALQDFRAGKSIRPHAHDAEHLHHVIEGVEQFARRELLALCGRTPKLAALQLSVGHPTTSTSTIRLPIQLAVEGTGSDAPAAPADLVLQFIERGGRLVVMVEPGFAADLDDDARAELSDVLLGVFQKANVDAIIHGTDPAGTEQPMDLDETTGNRPIEWSAWVNRWDPAQQTQSPLTRPDLAILPATS